MSRMLRFAVALIAISSARATLFGLESVVGIEDLAALSRFSMFTQQYGKQYADLKEAHERFQIYKSNLVLARLQQQNELGTAIYGETQFMDLTPEEFELTYLSKMPKSWTEAPLLSAEEIQGLSNESVPNAVDFREQGRVTAVKNQASCGSCWAFSAVANIEGLWKAKTGELLSLSEQELLDCDKIDEACNGGWMLDAFSEFIRLGGIETDKDYHYTARKGSCKFSKDKVAAYINGSLTLPKHDEEAMKTFLAKNGPISIALNANSLMFYRSGVIHPRASFCNPKRLTHGVAFVGYGEEKSQPFWIAKNSWGKNFGEKGYFRMYRGDNTCGVAEYAVSAVIN